MAQRRLIQPKGAQRRSLLVALGAALLLAAALMPVHADAASKRPTNPPPPTPPVLLDIGDPVRNWFGLVPETEETRRFLTFGDIEAWEDEADLGDVDSVADLDALGEEARRQWLVDMGIDSALPPFLRYSLDDLSLLEERLGFGLFTTQQALFAGELPGALSVLRVEADAEQIGAALEAAGYTAEALDGALLYSKGDDFGVDLQAETNAERFGEFARVAVLPRGDESDLLVARATSVITAALAAWNDETDSLFDDMGYRTLGLALDDGELAPGQLVGLIVLGGEQEPFFMPGDDDGNAVLEALLADYAEEPLPPYRMVAFSTYRDGADTYLVLSLVLAPGEDASSTASILAERLEEYPLATVSGTLGEAAEVTMRGAFINELEVASVTLRVLPEAPTAFSWERLVALRDYSFLAPGE